MRNTSGHSGQSKELSLSCAIRQPGFPRDIQEVRWFRNGQDISNKVGFVSMGMNLLVQVGFL